MENFTQREYPDCDTYFDRHEIQRYVPESYPKWTKKQWEAVWHGHNKFLRDKQKRLQEETELQRRREAYKRIQISTIMKLIEIIGEKKQEKIRQDISYTQQRMQAIAFIRSQNASKSLQMFLQNINEINKFEDEYLIYLVYISWWRENQKGTPKANKAHLSCIRGVLADALLQRGIFIGGDALKNLFQKISPENIKRYANMLSKGML